MVFMRAGVIVAVATNASMSPFCTSGMRLSDFTWTSSTLSGEPRTCLAIARAMSTSNPATWFVCGLSEPNGGASYFTPILIVPRLRIASTELSSAARDGTDEPSTSVAARESVAARTARRARIMVNSLVGEDLREKQLRPRIGRRGEEPCGRGLLDDASGVHEDDAVADLPSEPHLVGHHDHRDAGMRQCFHHVEDFLDHLRIEGAGRLVEEQHLGLHRQRSGDRDPLLLAARELRRGRRSFLREPDAFQQRACLALGLLARDALHRDRCQRDVLQGRLVRIEMKGLKDHPDLAPDRRQLTAFGGQAFAAAFDAAVLHRLEPVDAADQRALP